MQFVHGAVDMILATFTVVVGVVFTDTRNIVGAWQWIQFVKLKVIVMIYYQTHCIDTKRFLSVQLN